MSALHTPGTWVRKDTPHYADIFAANEQGELTHVAMVARAEDADRIVQCVNSYDELLAALALAAANLRVCWHPDTWERDPAAIKIRAAIAKAGGAA